MPISVDPSLAFPDLTAQLRPPSNPSTQRVDSTRFADALARAASAAPQGSGPALVEATRTRLSGQQAAGALAAAWHKVTGQPPSPKTLSILVGQWAHETGRGAAMLNYNFGGIKGTGTSGMSAIYKTREGWGEDEVRISDRFRAYASPEEGAEDYVGLLARRYPDAVRAARDEDPQAFVQALKARGYFTGNEASYVRSVTALASQALAEGFGALGSSEEASAPVPFAPLASAPLPASIAEQPETPSTRTLARWERSSFADEVNRAALLISALRIGQTGERRS